MVKGKTQLFGQKYSIELRSWR